MAIPSKRLWVENAKMTRDAWKCISFFGTWGFSFKLLKCMNIGCKIDQTLQRLQTLFAFIKVEAIGTGGRLERNDTIKIIISKIVSLFSWLIKTIQDSLTSQPVRIRGKGEKRNRRHKMVIRQHWRGVWVAWSKSWGIRVEESCLCLALLLLFKVLVFEDVLAHLNLSRLGIPWTSFLAWKRLPLHPPFLAMIRLFWNKYM